MISVFAIRLDMFPNPVSNQKEQRILISDLKLHRGFINVAIPHFMLLPEKQIKRLYHHCHFLKK